MQKLLDKIRKKYGNIPVSYISIKPSIARWNLKQSIHFTNKLAQELEKKDNNFHFVNIYDAMLKEDGTPNPIYLEQDGLHLSKEGYQLWNEILKNKPEIFPKN